MSKELLIDASHPEETRIAIKSDRGIEEYEYENIHRKNLKGCLLYTSDAADE